MNEKCEGCMHLKCIPMVCRGVMDCDAPEIYCKLDKEEFYDDEMECDEYKEDNYTYDDYLEDHWDERNER